MTWKQRASSIRAWMLSIAGANGSLRTQRTGGDRICIYYSIVPLTCGESRQLPETAEERIDELLEPDHPARAVWSYVEGLDLTFLYDRIRARGSVAGRPPIDPRLLVALWLYATLSGFSSARELADLCIRHDAFRWLAGGVSVNYHTLADFRTDHPEFLEELLTQSVEVLRQQGLIDLGRIAQDGMRVRASAGAASFHRRATLERLLQEAQAEVRRLQQKLAEAAADP